MLHGESDSVPPDVLVRLCGGVGALSGCSANGLLGTLLALAFLGSDDPAQLRQEVDDNPVRVVGGLQLEGEAALDHAAVLDRLVAIGVGAHLAAGAVAEPSHVDVDERLLVHDADIVFQEDQLSVVLCDMCFVIQRDQPQSLVQEQTTLKLSLNKVLC